MEKEEQALIGRIIFKKYILRSLLGKGCFSKVYLGQNIINKKLYAIKTENIFSEKQYLRDEAFRLYNLKGFGIPEVIGFGRSGNYRCLIQTLLGKTLNDYFYVEKKQKISNKDICIIAIQTLERIEFVHSKNYIHRDIKPSNFLFGNSDNSIIYLIDFGSARKYRNTKTGKHISQMKTQRIIGTTLFLSLNVLKGYEQSRRDDLESLGYMYILLSKGYLPWMDLLSDNIEEILEYTKKIKNNILIEDLCKDLPKEFCYYMNYVKNLNFEEKPDYEYLKNLFKNILVNIDISTWINKKTITPRNTKNKIYSLKKKNLQSIRRNIIQNYLNKKNNIKTEFINKMTNGLAKKEVKNKKQYIKNDINNMAINILSIKEDKNKKRIFSRNNNKDDSKEKRSLSKTNTDSIKLEGIHSKYKPNHNKNIINVNSKNTILNNNISSIYLNKYIPKFSQNIKNYFKENKTPKSFNNNNSFNNKYSNFTDRENSNNSINLSINKKIKKHHNYIKINLKRSSNCIKNINLQEDYNIHNYNRNNNRTILIRSNYNNNNSSYNNNYSEEKNGNNSLIKYFKLKSKINYVDFKGKNKYLTYQNYEKKK